MTTEEKLASLQESIKKAKELGIARTQNEFAELIGCSPVTNGYIHKDLSAADAANRLILDTIAGTTYRC